MTGGFETRLSCARDVEILAGAGTKARHNAQPIATGIRAEIAKELGYDPLNLTADQWKEIMKIYRKRYGI